MRYILKFIAYEIIYMGHLQAIGAAGIVYIASTLFNLPVPIALLFATYALFQGIYYYDRYRDIEIDRETNGRRTRHLETYAKYIPVVLFMYFVIAAFLFLHLNIGALLVLATIIALFGIFYPIYFKAITSKVQMFKDFYVASVFAVLVFFPLLYNGTPLQVSALILGLLGFVFIESFIMQLALDLKDSKSDARLGLRTLPASVGRGDTATYILTLSIGFSGIIIGYGAQQSLPAMFILLAIATLLFNLFTLTAIKQRHTWGYLLTSGKYLYWLLIILLLQYA